MNRQEYVTLATDVIAAEYGSRVAELVSRRIDEAYDRDQLSGATPEEIERALIRGSDDVEVKYPTLNEIGLSAFAEHEQITDDEEESDDDEEESDDDEEESDDDEEESDDDEEESDDDEEE